MAHLLLLEELYARVRRERVFREREDLLTESDDWLMSHFRFPRHVLLELCSLLEARLKRETRRSNALPVPVQVLVTLGFLATGTFQRELGDRTGISQPTISRMMPAVLDAIKSLSRTYIRFPYSDADADAQHSVIKEQFREIAGFPGVVGAIGCTHVRLKAPSVNPDQFINTKNHHSINVQVICDAKLALLNVVARWPGSTHEAFIFNNSSVGARLHEGALRGHSHLLGDESYPLTEYLITPLEAPATDQEHRFNNAHAQTHATVERCLGLLKGRWQCLGTEGGMLLYTPVKACHMILACSVLHNFAQTRGVPLEVAEQPEEPMPRKPWAADPPLDAVRRRQDLISHF